MTVDVVVWTHHFTKLQTKVILRFLKLFKKNPKSGFGDIPYHGKQKTIIGVNLLTLVNLNMQNKIQEYKLSH